MTTKSKTEAKPKTAKKGKVPSGVTYELGEAKYNPRVEHTAVAWEKVQSTIQKGKGKATHAELCAALEHHATKDGEDHHDFIGYMVRRKSLKVVQA